MAVQGNNRYRVVLKPNDSLEGIPESSLIQIPVSRTSYNAIKTKVNGQGLNVCDLLEGTIGESVACSIHPTKPRACKDFLKGGPNCLFYRKRLDKI